MVPDIILDTEEDGFYHWTDNYDECDNTPHTPVEEDVTGGSHTFNDDNRVFNITKSNKYRTSKTRTVIEVSELSNQLDFYISKCQSQIRDV